MSDTSAVGMNALNGAFVTLAVIITGLRFYARRCQKAPLLIDDWLILPALLTFLGCAASLFYDVQIKALGYSSHDFTPEEAKKHYKQSQQIAITLDVLTVVCLGCIKTSALMFYRRIFCVGSQKNSFNIIILITVGLVAAWVITYCLLSGFQCQLHLEESWDNPKVKAKYCAVTFPFLYSLAITDLIFDIWVLILPIPSIIRLNTTTGRKLAIFGIFLLACVGLGAAITRAIIFAQVYFAGPVALATQDFEKTSTKIQFYMVLEAGMAFLAVNLPSVWLVFATIAPEGILRSVRSVVSLSSFRSRGSKTSQTGSQYATKNKDAPKSSASLSSTAHLGESSAYCMHDFHQQDVHDVPTGQIRVQHSQTLSSQSRNRELV